MKNPGSDKRAHSSDPAESGTAPGAGDLYERLLDRMKDGVLVVDRKGFFTVVNEVICTRVGRPREWFMGRNYAEFLHGEQRDRVQERFRALIGGADQPPIEVGYASEAGKTVWVEVNASRLVEKGRVTGVLAVTRDITE